MNPISRITAWFRQHWPVSRKRYDDLARRHGAVSEALRVSIHGYATEAIATKDLRGWLRSGATGDVLRCVIENTGAWTQESKAKATRT